MEASQAPRPFALSPTAPQQQHQQQQEQPPQSVASTLSRCALPWQKLSLNTLCIYNMNSIRLQVVGIFPSEQGPSFKGPFTKHFVVILKNREMSLKIVKSDCF